MDTPAEAWLTPGILEALRGEAGSSSSSSTLLGCKLAMPFLAEQFDGCSTFCRCCCCIKFTPENRSDPKSGSRTTLHWFCKVVALVDEFSPVSDAKEANSLADSLASNGNGQRFPGKVTAGVLGGLGSKNNLS